MKKMEGTGALNGSSSDRNQRRAVVKAAMNLQIPKIAGNF